MSGYSKCFLSLMIVLFAISSSCAAINKNLRPFHRSHKQWQRGQNYAFVDKNYYSDLGSSLKYVISSPMRWQEQQWWDFVLVTGISGLVLALDEDLNTKVRTKKSDALDSLSSFGRTLGNPSNLIPLSVLSYTVGFALHQPEVQDLSLTVFETLFMSNTIVSGVTLLSHRYRPNSGHSSGKFNGPLSSFSDQEYAFPSSYAASAFAVATVFSEKFNESSWVPWISYGLAGVVSWSGMYRENDWASDAVVGGLIGFYTAKMVLNYHPKEVKGVPQIGINFRNGIGSQLKISF